MLRILSATCFTTFLLASALPQSADACSQPEWGWSIYSQQPTLEQVPVQGQVLIPAYYYGDSSVPSLEDSIQFVTIDVFDSTESPVAGQARFDEELNGFLWTSSEPLEAGADYFLTYTIDYQSWNPNDYRGTRSETVPFTTRRTVLEPLAVPRLREVELRENQKSDTVCCPLADEFQDQCIIAMCGPVPDVCQGCFADNFTYNPQLFGTWDVDAPGNAITMMTVYRRAADGSRVETGRRVLGPEGTTGGGSAQFEGDGPYCIQLELTRMADGATVTTEWSCAEKIQLQRRERRDPDYSILAQCAELPEGYDIDGPKEVDDRRLDPDAVGCTTFTPEAATPIGLLLVALPLFARRRRR